MSFESVLSPEEATRAVVALETIAAAADRIARPGVPPPPPPAPSSFDELFRRIQAIAGEQAFVLQQECWSGLRSLTATPRFRVWLSDFSQHIGSGDGPDSTWWVDPEALIEALRARLAAEATGAAAPAPEVSP